MKKNLKTLVIIFSVVLNIVFIGSYVYNKSGLQIFKGHRGNNNSPLYEELNLSEEQLDRCKSIRADFHTFLNRQSKVIKGRQLELIDLLAKENIDYEAIDTKKKEIQTLQQQMQTKVIDHLLDENRNLTPVQRELFFKLFKERIEKNEGFSPQMMSQTRLNNSGDANP